MLLLSKMCTTLRAYNRGISLTDSELVVLLQDDDIPPLSTTGWFRGNAVSSRTRSCPVMLVG